MDLNLKDQLFVVGGATSGFGKSVAEALAAEGAQIIAVARGEEKLKGLEKTYKGQLQVLVADITAEDTVGKLLSLINGRQLHGILMNAGGPPAMTVLESRVQNWDDAYHLVLRWKVNLLLALIPLMKKEKYGRVLFVESASVKQPMENLVLSNAFRVAVIGFMKTFSQEISADGITLNALAPGFHDTNALDRIITKKKEQTGVTEEAARQAFIKDSQVGFLGAIEDFASLAVWLLSGHSRYITGQTITVAGGMVKGLMG